MAVLEVDPAAALEWLAKAFGFETRMSLPGPDGGIMHAEMQVADGVIMMSPTADQVAWRSPQSLDGSVTQSLYVYVDDVDAHHERAREAGATIVAAPDDHYGERTYRALDTEGHRWMFSAPLPAAEDSK